MSRPQPAPGHLTFHLTPSDVWRSQRDDARYVPEGFEREGFVHCTDDLAALIAVGNRYYRADQRPYLCLVVSCDALDHPVVYEDDAQMFPHIYGPIPRQAIIGTRDVVRDGDGRFTGIAE